MQKKKKVTSDSDEKKIDCEKDEADIQKTKSDEKKVEGTQFPSAGPSLSPHGDKKIAYF